MFFEQRHQASRILNHTTFAVISTGIHERHVGARYAFLYYVPEFKQLYTRFRILGDTAKGMKTNKSFKGSFPKSLIWNTAGGTV
jgi:hypothetical protein